MLALVAVLLAADEAEVAVLPAEEEDVEAPVPIALETHHALVGDGDAESERHVDRVVAELLVAPVGLPEIECEVLVVAQVGNGDDQIAEAVLVDVGLGGDEIQIRDGTQLRDGFAALQKNGLAPGREGRAERQQGKDASFHSYKYINRCKIRNIRLTCPPDDILSLAESLL